ILYKELNKEYESIAKQVNFLSPVFYNYNKNDFKLWKAAVDFNMAESQKYAKKYNLKVYPYIRATYSSEKFLGKRKASIQLTASEMEDRLLYLYKMGANGVIIWESSEIFELNGEKPILDFQKGWP